MGWISELVGGGLSLVAREKAGEAYRKGFEDARRGNGKDPSVIKMKAILKRSRVAAFSEAEETIIEAYEEGYKDGIDRERLDKLERY